MSTFTERRMAKQITRLNSECALLIAALEVIRDKSADHDDAKTIAKEMLEELESGELEKRGIL